MTTRGALEPPSAQPHGLPALLATRGLDASGWQLMSQRGYSGARVHRRRGPDGASYVLKTTSADIDWIMRATADDTCREAVLADTSLLADPRVSSPAIGSAHEDGAFSILMHDIGDQLLLDGALVDGTLREDQLGAVLRGMTRLHAMPPPARAGVSWCPVDRRLTLFRPDAEWLDAFPAGPGIRRGWEVFFELAPVAAVDLVRGLFEDTDPLVRALARLPDSLLHGDLKLDNVGVRPDGGLALIDWSLTMLAPAAVDLGWFLAMNSRALPVSLDETIARYLADSDLDPEQHDGHTSLAIICGLLIRGWRKALDAAAGDGDELRWWCERAVVAATAL